MRRRPGPGGTRRTDEPLGRRHGILPSTGNTSSPSNRRLTAGSTYNGIPGAFDGTALLLFTASGLSGTDACSGSLMNGGEYVLTAAHCVDGLISMSVRFGYTNRIALETRTVVAASYQASGWNGTLDMGADIALVKLNAPVTDLPIYALSTGSDIGKLYIMTGYGTSGIGRTSTAPKWNDGACGHDGYDTFDVPSDVVFGAWDATHPGAGTYTPPTFGHTSVTDVDAPSPFPNASNDNGLQRIADLRPQHRQQLELRRPVGLDRGLRPSGRDLCLDRHLGARALQLRDDGPGAVRRGRRGPSPPRLSATRGLGPERRPNGV